MIRKSYAALRNLVTSLPNPNPNSDPNLDPNSDPNPDPNPNISGQVESESEKNGSDPHHWVIVRSPKLVQARSNKARATINFLLLPRE